MMALLQIVFLLVHLIFASLILFLTIAFVTGAPFVPTTSAVADAMIRLARIKKGSRVYDLGSGDGRLLRKAAYLGADAVGFEINPYLVLLATICGIGKKTTGTQVTVWKNFWSQPLQNADVLFVYLLPNRMQALEKKILSELSPNARIVSNSFIFPNLVKLAEDPEHHVFVFAAQKK